MVETLTTIWSWVSELISNMKTSTPQGFVGVGLIFFYFVVMMAAVAMRIKRADHVSHH